MAAKGLRKEKRMFFHQGVLSILSMWFSVSSEWSFIRMVSILSRWFSIPSEWSLIRLVSHQGGLLILSG